MAAGEALAIAFELGRECSEDFADDFVTDLVDTLRQLATDSHKYRAKKDRKQQRATFRDILHYIEVRKGVVKQLNLTFGLHKTNDVATTDEFDIRVAQNT